MGIQAGLQRPGLGTGQMVETLDAVGGRLDEDGLDPLNLGLVRCHDQLAAFAIVDLVAVEKGIERPPSLDAEPRLQRTGRIVETTVDDLGIARGDALADVGLLLQHQHRQTSLGQRPAAGEADRAGAHHRRVEVEAHPFGP